MRFDPALKRAVRDRAPAGMEFGNAEIEQALRWAYDIRASSGAPHRLDPIYRDTHLGQAAVAAVAAYRPQAAGPVDVGVRLGLFALAAMIPTLAVVFLLALVLRVGGVHFGINRWGLLAGYLAWIVVGWLLRDRINLFEPRYAARTIPAPRAGEPDPIATTMTDPELQARDPASGGTERATH